jgi:PAS domain S-box-containing protein
VLSASNKAIVHIHDKKKLLKEICRISVEEGGFTMVWAGLVNGESHLIEPVAVHGPSEGFLDRISISIDDGRSQGPTSTAFREGTYNVCNDIATDERMKSVREPALKRGFRALAAFPFALDSKNAGVITFYASQPGFFNNSIIRLLNEQSGDISFAFVTLDHEEQRINAENELRMSELQYRRLFETAQDAILILNGDTGEVIDANKFILDMLGYPLEYFVGKHLWELGFIKDKFIALNAFTELKTNGYIRYENLPLETKDGQRFNVEFISNVYLVGDKKIIQCNIRDITDKKVIQEALQASETRYRRLFETAQDGILILDEETGKIIDANKFILDMLQYPLEYFVGKHLWELGFIKDKFIALKAFTELKTNGYIRYENLPLETKDGRSINVEFISNVYLVGEKKIFQCDIRDITNRKGVQDTLQISETRYRRLFETAQDAILILNGDTGEIIVANKFIIDMLGYPLEYFVGKHLWELGFIKDKFIALKAFTELKTNGYIRYENLPLETKDGRSINVEFISNVYFVGEKKKIQCNIRDITKRKWVLDTLQASELRYRRLFETAQDAILILDGDTGEVIDANTFILDMLGYPLEYFIGKHLWELGFIKDKTIAQRAFTELVANNYIRYEDMPLETKDGQSIDVEFISNAYLVGNKKIIQCDIRNITQRKRAEYALALASRKLKLLSGITRHDINNQMTELQGYLQILEKRQPDPSLNEYFQKASAAAQRISSIIRFTKEYESLGVNAPVWQDVNTLVDTAAKQAPLEKIILRNDLPARTEVFADPLIVKVFYTLMDNAVRHGGKITTLRFSIQESGNTHIIICEDDGDGILVEEKEKIFEQGFGKNTGFGLFITQEILSLTGITITETGEPGTGARFEILVPNSRFRVAQPSADPR